MRRAVDYVEVAHSGQRRKGTDAPYAVHPIRIASLLVDAFGIEDADVLQAALLHDVLEETPISKESLTREFGGRCAALVSALTRTRDEARPAYGDPADSTYLLRIRDLGDDAILVKLADKIDNLRDAPSHPDRDRVGIFINETFSAYVPLARALSDPRQARRAARLLLEAAACTGNGLRDPHFLTALLSAVSRAIGESTTERGTLDDIPFPRAAADLYLYFNPEACAWLEFDGVALAYERVQPRELARRICSSLCRTMAGPELPILVELAGIPPAFVTAEKEWRRAAASVASVQRELLSSNPRPWFDVLLRAENAPALLAAIQSCIYFPASWRSPLWATDLGATFANRMAGVWTSFPLRERLALQRYADGSGPATRAAKMFADKPPGLDSEALWALRIAVEWLQTNDSSALEALWRDVHGQPFEARSLPARNGFASVETIGFRETRSVFEAVGAHDAFARLTRLLMQEQPDVTRWIEFDDEEWRKRTARWSQPGQLSISDHESEEVERSGLRVLRRRFGEIELLKVLPARRFALQDRLPELTGDDLRHIEDAQFTAVSIFDRMILDARLHRWTPRVYRILDTIADLDPEGVQTLTVEYDAREAVPKLEAYLPLPDGDDPRQTERRRFIARYITAQVYSSALVRRVRGARVSASAVAESRRRHAFTDRELEAALSDAEREGGFRESFGKYVEQFGFDAFGITTQTQVSHFNFGPAEMRSGTHVGIDIGGQRIKIAVVRDGVLIENPVRREIGTPAHITVEEFCRQILDHVSDELRDVGVKWDEVGGVGISWPGGVRDNRIAAISRVLSWLSDEGRQFSYHDSLDRLARFDLLSHFAGTARPGLSWALVNDGDAEAFGNHVLRTLSGIGRPGGKIFVKLGTSLAGGRVTPDGAVADDIAEFSKIVLNLTAPTIDAEPGSLARHYISAEGVRNLSRTFEFDGAPLFGDRDGANGSGSTTRIEPVEIGQLLALFTPDRAFLDELIDSDNEPCGLHDVVASAAAALQTTKRQALIDYIRLRASDLGCQSPGWTSGLRRTLWLFTGFESESPAPDGTLPHDFAYDAAARSIVGSVALFSQLGLHVAHLIAQLYNIYRRGAFSEVILAGGVLTGRSGEIVERQAKGFLAKYYDKIYGNGRPLGPETLVRAGVEGVSNPGVFGAAMAANRQWQVDRIGILARRIEEHLNHHSIGEEITVEEILSFAEDTVMRDHALRILDEYFVRAAIAPASGGRIQKIT